MAIFLNWILNKYFSIEKNYEEKLDYLVERYEEITIVTSSGIFRIFNENFHRMPRSILYDFFDVDQECFYPFSGDLHYEMFDHAIFGFIFRYINHGIKIDLKVVSANLGLTREECLMLLEEWGCDESIYKRED
jgi:hypothetical protein